MEIVPGLEYGVYSYAEAARLLGITPQRLKRWADGYFYERRDGQRYSAPVLRAHAHREGVLTFPELIELFFVREFVALGVPLPHIRKTADALEHEVGEFPFSRRQVLVEGRRLLVREAEGLLKRPDIGQLVADFAEQFAQHIEFDGDLATRYYPQGYNRQVFLDRRIRGGEPVVAVNGRAIPTRIIFALWQREKNPESVADYFEIPLSAVSAAIRYEGEWRLSA
ncbi:MAG: hypothetical protein K6U12_02100 [Armatimonadetes bacterium]|nr:hypothetical protein [Armatimonadota bacterium]CUU36870.1 hypothetical protein DCOP10_11948 [Armatimonadetes bacterium DC]